MYHVANDDKPVSGKPSPYEPHRV